MEKDPTQIQADMVCSHVHHKIYQNWLWFLPLVLYNVTKGVTVLRSDHAVAGIINWMLKATVGFHVVYWKFFGWSKWLRVWVIPNWSRAFCWDKENVTNCDQAFFFWEKNLHLITNHQVKKNIIGRTHSNSKEKEILIFPSNMRGRKWGKPNLRFYIMYFLKYLAC